VGDRVGLTRKVEGIPTWALAAWSSALWAAAIAYAHLGSRFSLDLRVYREATSSLIHGHDPYLLSFTSSHLPFTYPPFALLVLAPFSAGSVHLVEAVWWCVNAAAMTAVVSLAVARVFALPRWRAAAIALVATPVLNLAFEPLRSNTNYGQINGVLFLLVLIDLVGVRGRGRGALVGLASAVKLTPLVYLVYFAVSRQWHALVRGLVTFAGIGLAVFVVLPGESRLFWFHQVVQPGRTGDVGSVRNQSLYGLLHRWPFPGDGAQLLWFALALLTVAAGIGLTRRLMARDRVIDAVVALGLTGELVSPVSWTHHWVWIALLPLLLVRGFTGQPAVTVTMVLLCVVGVLGPYMWVDSGWIHRGLSDSLVLSGVLLLVTWLISETRRQDAPGADVVVAAHST
jgi:alpha-1,2-mannosyltransferase